VIRPGEQERARAQILAGSDVVTPADLITQHVAGTTARPLARGRRTVVLRDIAVATVGPDPAGVTPMCAVSARDMPVVDTLAAVAAQDPSGVLLIETRNASFAFEVTGGRITGARGSGPRGQLEPWVAEVHRRHPERFARDRALGTAAPAWLEVARAFVEEHVLDQLALCREPGARLTLARGDIQWIGTRIPAHVGPTLRHLLLEHARRYDEEPRILAALGELDRVAVPLREPGPQPSAKPAAAAGEDEGWDFFDDPDPAAMAEWDDAVRIWSLCDGQSNIAEIVDEALLGRFRGLLALHTLVKAGHVMLIEPSHRRPAPASGEHPLAEVIPMMREQEARNDEHEMEVDADPAVSSVVRPIVRLAPDDAIASDPDWEEHSTAYSFVLRKPAPRRKPARADGPVPPPPPWAAKPSVAKVPDAIDRMIAEVVDPIFDGAAATRREAIVDTAADTRREAIPEVDGPAETRREMILDPGTAPIDLEERTAPTTAASATSTRAGASRSVGQVLDRALPSALFVSIALATTGLVAVAAAVLAITS